MKILESLHFLINKNIDALGYSTKTPIIKDVLIMTEFNQVESLLTKCLNTGISKEQNSFDILQYLGDGIQFEFDSIDVRHKATAIMCHMYDHCFGTNGLYGTDIIDLFVLQSYYFGIEDQEYIKEWKILIDILVEFIKNCKYISLYPDNYTEQLITKLRYNFVLEQLNVYDCNGFDFQFFGYFQCVNPQELKRVKLFLSQYYPGLEQGLKLVN